MALLLPPLPLHSLRLSTSLSPSSSSHGRNHHPHHRSHVRPPKPSPRMASMDGYPLALPSVPPRRRPPYVRRGSCLVVPPPSPARKPSAVVKFLGGAFVGAVPELTYSHFMELLAREGFLVVSVPYDVTFDHERAAKEVFERFHSCLDSLLDAGIPDAGLEPSDLSRLPIFSVGHSNGALLQLLVGSYFSEKIPKANAVISFNNKPAAEAVPYFEQLGPMVSQVMPIMEVSPVYSMARNASDDAWKALLDTAGTLIQEYDQEIMVSLNKFADQIPSVMNQVTQGISEFRPTPSENRQLFKKSYSVPHTLLVKFSDDPIDETDLLEDILRPRVASIGGSIEKVTLSGTHLTPCAQDLQWQVGPQYTPADAVAQSLKSLSLNDTRVLARTIADWFKRIDPE
ncbi:uncharacterized protein LOC109725694 isoform X2 [Ananas comosus]|uniref:Uncharacterized protein LOC109725694 isoform X2 n=1 Tax=Ananas comosus TaxID=4615 RepID=A0A6P5GY24_ANACO|nr:uncharacterized protein LOC109725694 isoform X2 [Ananas comosus]